MYVIHCYVSGGVTGTREGLLKDNDQVKRFDTYEVAEKEAEALNQSRNGPNARAFFSYTVRKF